MRWLISLALAVFVFTAGRPHPPELGPHFKTSAPHSSVVRVIKAPVFLVKDLAVAKHRFTQSTGSAAVRLGVDLFRIALRRMAPGAVRTSAGSDSGGGEKPRSGWFGWDRF